MKRKICLLILLSLALSGCFFPKPTPNASIKITSWEQDYSSYSEEYRYVYVYFEVTNTASVDIDYYEVWFDVKCADGSVYQDWTNGSHLLVGKKLSDWTMISTAHKRAVSVTATDFRLWSY